MVYGKKKKKQINQLDCYNNKFEYLRVNFKDDGGRGLIVY